MTVFQHMERDMIVGSRWFTSNYLSDRILAFRNGEALEESVFSLSLWPFHSLNPSFFPSGTSTNNQRMHRLYIDTRDFRLLSLGRCDLRFSVVLRSE
jgi:hypothetical protein